MTKKRRPVKKSRIEERNNQPKKPITKQQIAAYTIGILVIGSMTIGILFSAFSGF